MWRNRWSFRNVLFVAHVILRCALTFTIFKFISCCEILNWKNLFPFWALRSWPVKGAGCVSRHSNNMCVFCNISSLFHCFSSLVFVLSNFKCHYSILTLLQFRWLHLFQGHTTQYVDVLKWESAVWHIIWQNWLTFQQQCQIQLYFKHALELHILLVWRIYKLYWKVGLYWYIQQCEWTVWHAFSPSENMNTLIRTM